MALNVAVALLVPLTTTEQEAFPEQLPLHPEKTEPSDAAEAINVTVVPLAKSPVHDWPQVMPGGLLVTFPVPEPEICTVSCDCDWPAEVLGELPGAGATEFPPPPHAIRSRSIGKSARDFIGVNQARYTDCGCRS